MCCLCNFQSLAKAYKLTNRDGDARVLSFQPRPMIKIKPNAKAGFRTYSFIEAISSLEPLNGLVMNDTDYQYVFILLLVL